MTLLYLLIVIAGLIVLLLGSSVRVINQYQVSVAELSVVFALKTRSCAIGLCGC